MVVVGAINVDLVIRTPRLPGPGETVVGPAVQQFGGGKGANAAVAAARNGAVVRLVGAVGADDLGTAAIEQLRGDGVDITNVRRLDTSTGTAFIVVDDHGENQIAVGAGANAALTAEHVTEAMKTALEEAGCVLVSTEISGPAVTAAVRAATEAGLPCLLNPAPVIDAVRDLLTLGPLLTPNATEILELSDDGDIPTRATAVSALTGSPVIVTLGGDGVLVVDRAGNVTTIPARPVKVSDTTGAGDTFNGVLAARLAAGDPLVEAVTTAAAAASMSVTKVGAREGMPTAAELTAWRRGESNP